MVPGRTFSRTFNCLSRPFFHRSVSPVFRQVADRFFHSSLSRIFALLAVFGGSAFAAGVEAPWVRPTAPGAKVGGAFMTLVGGKEADRMISASSPVAAVVELHTHLMEDGVAKMRAIPVIEVPAGGKVELKPGGLHLMLINLKAPLKAGETVPLKLRFEKAGEVDILVPVSAQAPAGGHSHHGGHDGK